MTTQPITFDTQLTSYGPCSNPHFHSDPGWDITLDGTNDKSGERHTTRVEIHGYGACPFNPANQDARVRVTVEILTPKTRVLMWDAKDVPLGCWVRARCDAQHDDPTKYLVTAVLTKSVRLGNGRDYDFLDLKESFEHSTDGGKTWSPAGRVEEVYE